MTKMKEALCELPAPLDGLVHSGVCGAVGVAARGEGGARAQRAAVGAARAQRAATEGAARRAGHARARGGGARGRAWRAHAARLAVPVPVAGRRPPPLLASERPSLARVTVLSTAVIVAPAIVATSVRRSLHITLFRSSIVL